MGTFKIILTSDLFSKYEILKIKQNAITSTIFIFNKQYTINKNRNKRKKITIFHVISNTFQNQI
jgi:hypothetical protein